MNKKDSEKLSSFLEFIREVKNQRTTYEEIISDCDKQTQDLLHQIELGPYKVRQKFTTQLAHIRQKRRIAKDWFDIHKSLIELIDDSIFSKNIKNLEQVLGSMRKSEKIVEAQRVYRPRVRTDLTINTVNKEKVK